MPDVKDKPCILVVDDEPSVGDALRIVLESNGYEVVLVTNGQDGIEQARNRNFGFSVVDLFLTDISGFQVITDLRNLQPHIPILLITAHGSPQIFAEAKRLGAIGALSKPFPPAEILKLIDSYMHGPTTDSL
ncbi:MAG TPA: response regulator [Pyrinomonadaceae bacterium]|nr:response regulator [Pyrinomonadaceae bacterium]